MPAKTPSGYEQKFADFVRLCEESKGVGTDSVVIAYPGALGDTYEEIVESLARLAEAGLSLHIAARQ